MSKGKKSGEELRIFRLEDKPKTVKAKKKVCFELSVFGIAWIEQKSIWFHCCSISSKSIQNSILMTWCLLCRSNTNLCKTRVTLCLPSLLFFVFLFCFCYHTIITNNEWVGGWDKRYKGILIHYNFLNFMITPFPFYIN